MSLPVNLAWRNPSLVAPVIASGWLCIGLVHVANTYIEQPASNFLFFNQLLKEWHTSCLSIVTATLMRRNHNEHEDKYQKQEGKHE
jgi:hypothetical protein